MMKVNMRNKPYKISYYLKDDTTYLVTSIINAPSEIQALKELTRPLDCASKRYRIIEIKEYII